VIILNADNVDNPGKFFVEPTQKWARNLLRRHDEMVLRTVNEMEKKKIAASTQDMVDEVFDYLESVVHIQNYKPELLYNLDETSLLNKKMKHYKVITDKLHSFLYTPKQNIITSSTAVPVIAADGNHLKTAMLFSDSFDLTPLRKHHPTDFVYYNTPRGYMTTRVLEHFILEVLLPDIQKRREQVRDKGEELPRALLMLDGFFLSLFLLFLHFFILKGPSSRFNPVLWETCKNAGLDLYILKANMSHLLQPLDRHVNAMIKKFLHDCDSFCSLFH
jgi:hypothetical protein